MTTSHSCKAASELKDLRYTSEPFHPLAAARAYSSASAALTPTSFLLVSQYLVAEPTSDSLALSSKHPKEVTFPSLANLTFQPPSSVHPCRPHRPQGRSTGQSRRNGLPHPHRFPDRRQGPLSKEFLRSPVFGCPYQPSWRHGRGVHSVCSPYSVSHAKVLAGKRTNLSSQSSKG